MQKFFEVEKVYVCLSKSEEKNEVSALIEDISDKYNLDLGEYTFDKLESGKPILRNSEYNVSISHSGEYITVGLSVKNFGIDIEKQRNISEDLKQYILDNDSSNLNPFEAWTMKEACFKADPYQEKQTRIRDYVLHKKDGNSKIFKIKGEQDRFFECFSIDLIEAYIFSIAVLQENEIQDSEFEKLDCYRIYVPSISEGVDFYQKKLGLEIKWKTENEVGFVMNDGVSELVIQNLDKRNEVDISVSSVDKIFERMKNAGAKIKVKPFDIKIGKCAVFEDPWGNELVLLDSTKGLLETDDEGNVVSG